MFLNTLFQKIRTYPWAQFCAPHLTRQRKFYGAFLLSNYGNPAKSRSKINPGLMSQDYSANSLPGQEYFR